MLVPTTQELQQAVEYIRDHPGVKRRHILRALGKPDTTRWNDLWPGLRRALEESSLAFYCYSPTGWFSPLSHSRAFSYGDRRCAELNLQQLKEINEQKEG